MIRLWVNDVDYGTMSDKAGQMYAEVAQRYGDICRLEPVGEDAPDFLTVLTIQVIAYEALRLLERILDERAMGSVELKAIHHEPSEEYRGWCQVTDPQSQKSLTVIRRADRSTLELCVLCGDIHHIAIMKLDPADFECLGLEEFSRSWLLPGVTMLANEILTDKAG